MPDGKVADIFTYTVQEVIEAVRKSSMGDSICTCKARVICTNAIEGSVPHHIKKGDGLVHMGNIEELNRTNIEICDNFKGCKKSSDEKCNITKKFSEWIEGKEWKAFDETSSQGKGKEKLNKDTSYMVCVEYGGIIYFHDDGQKIKDFLYQDEDDADFTDRMKTKHPDNVADMKKYIMPAKIEHLRTGVPWQVTLTQLVLESGWGSEPPVDKYTNVNSYNLFGIKNLAPDSDEDFVRSWTKETISVSELNKWKEIQKKWALEGEELEILVQEGDILRIKVIQPFRRFDSYEDGIAYHSEVLLEDRYLEAWENEKKYKDNPFIYVAVIAPIYAPGGAYEEEAENIMKGTFEWEDKEEDWKEYEVWKQSH